MKLIIHNMQLLLSLFQLHILVIAAYLQLIMDVFERWSVDCSVWPAAVH